MQWSDLWAAFAIYLIIEGMLPFANPAAWREAAMLMAQQSDGFLRRAGLISMFVGVALLFIARAGQ